MRGLGLTISIIFLLQSSSSPSEACTAFCLKRGDGIVVAKNLDWMIGDGFIVVNKKGISKTAFVNSHATPARWISRFGSITFNQFGKEFPLGGINQAGLVIEELSHSPSKYPAPDHRATVTELQWIQFQLDNYESTAEVLASDALLRISRLLFGLHYFVCDRFGSVAVIEFLDGRPVFYSGKQIRAPVLTNNSYANAVKYLGFHKEFGGEKLVSDSPDSPERFVRAATLLKNDRPSQTSSIAEDALGVLAAVEQQDTQWSIVYDPRNLELFFKTREDSRIRSLKLADFDFSDNTPPMIAAVNSQKHESGEPLFFNYSVDRNRRLLDSVFEKLWMHGEIEKAAAEGLVEKLTEYAAFGRSEIANKSAEVR